MSETTINNETEMKKKILNIVYDFRMGKMIWIACAAFVLIKQQQKHLLASMERSQNM